MKELTFDVIIGVIIYFIFLLLTKDKLLFEVINKIFGGKNEAKN